MFPCAIRRRSASAVMSTSSTWSAARTTASGTVSRCTTPVICSTTSVTDSRCCTLTAEITSMPASSSSLDVLPALLVLRSGHVGVRELVDQRDLRLAGEHRVDVHLLEERAPVLKALPRDDLEPVDQRGGLRPAVRLGERDDDVGPPFLPPVPLGEHGKRLAHPGRRPQVDAELPPGRGAIVASPSHISILGQPRRSPVPC